MCKRIAAILFVLLLSPSIAAIARAAAPIDAELGAISVMPAGWQLEIYPLPPSLPPLLPNWRSALRNALLQAAIFRGGAAPPLSLSVKVTEFALTGNTLTVFARYQLDSPGAAAPVFQTDVMTDAGVTTIDNGLPVVDYSARATEKTGSRWSKRCGRISPNLSPGSRLSRQAQISRPSPRSSDSGLPPRISIASRQSGTSMPAAGPEGKGKGGG